MVCMLTSLLVRAHTQTHTHTHTHARTHTHTHTHTHICEIFIHYTFLDILSCTHRQMIVADCTCLLCHKSHIHTCMREGKQVVSVSKYDFINLSYRDTSILFLQNIIIVIKLCINCYFLMSMTLFSYVWSTTVRTIK